MNLIPPPQTLEDVDDLRESLEQVFAERGHSFADFWLKDGEVFCDQAETHERAHAIFQKRRADRLKRTDRGKVR